MIPTLTSTTTVNAREGFRECVVTLHAICVDDVCCFLIIVVYCLLSVAGPIDFDRYDLTARTGHAPVGDRLRDLNPLHDALLRHHRARMRAQQQVPATGQTGDARAQLPQIKIQDQDAYKGAL